MTREKIKMVSGVPLIVTIEDTHAKPMTSRFHDGTEYLYSVMHRGSSCLLYLPVEGHEAMLRLGARAGDEVQLVKQQTQGQAPTFTARAVSDAHLAIPALPPPPPPQYSQPAPAAVAQGVRMLAPQTQFAPAPQPQTEAPAKVHPLEEIMQRCFVVAGRALWNAHRELAAAGCAYDQPTMEDMRAAGISMWIERTRNLGGR
jgi:hypothetical protein